MMRRMRCKELMDASQPVFWRVSPAFAELVFNGSFFSMDLFALGTDDADLLSGVEPEYAEVDDVVERGEVITRIEAAIMAALTDIAAKQLPTLHVASRGRRNAELVEDDTPQISDCGKRRRRNHCDETPLKLRLHERIVSKDLTSKQGVGAYPCIRGCDLQVVSPPVFASVRDVNEAIQDVVALLRVPRSSLGICCSSKGAVSGLLNIKANSLAHWEDCSSVGLMGRSIPGDPVAIEGMQIQCTARYILIVEKDAIFQRLTEDRFFDSLPCVLVTAKGMPDLATRIFLMKLHRSYPLLQTFGLVDWNPSGVSILGVYKYGSARGLESPRYALSTLKWLGIRHSMIRNVPETTFQPLTARDRSLIQTLKANLKHKPTWIKELSSMEQLECKCEIEAAYDVHGLEGLGKLLTSSILKGDFLD
ncbi:hypothetical protein BSKO_01495 [Bryopsis sp. KO-2023]|nr:hypothetical protein BSKO_01495 [Bryopsis sp. KO-2023]